MQMQTGLLLLAMMSVASAFAPAGRPLARRRQLASGVAAPQPALFAKDDDDDFSFTGTDNSRGTSFDQDGKANIWAVEPKMETADADGGVKIGILIGGGLVAASLLLGGTIGLLPDPSSL